MWKQLNFIAQTEKNLKVIVNISHTYTSVFLPRVPCNMLRAHRKFL